MQNIDTHAPSRSNLIYDGNIIYCDRRTNGRTNKPYVRHAYYSSD